jgi:hypothetical protein
MSATPPNPATEQAKATAEAINQLRQHVEFQAMLMHMRYTALRNAGFEHGQCIYLCQQDWSNVK